MHGYAVMISSPHRGLMIYECISRSRRVIHSMICQVCDLDKKQPKLSLAVQFRLFLVRVTGHRSKKVDNCFLQGVTEIRSVRREAMPRGKGDYISGSVLGAVTKSLRPTARRSRTARISAKRIPSAIVDTTTAKRLSFMPLRQDFTTPRSADLFAPIRSTTLTPKAPTA